MPKRPNIRIVIIEDNPGDAELMHEAFSERNPYIEIIWIEDGESAVDQLHAWKDRPHLLPHLVLLDLNLPRKSGDEVLASLKRDPLLRIIPVIIYSGSESMRDIDLVYRLHANCYITKPVNYEQFQQTARLIEKFWLNTARLVTIRETI